MMLNVAGMRKVAKRARKQFASMLALELGAEIYSAAMHGAEEVYKTFDLCAENLNFNLACEIGDQVVSELAEGYGYSIAYQATEGIKLSITFYAFWGEDEEDYCPVFNN